MSILAIPLGGSLLPVGTHEMVTLFVVGRYWQGICIVSPTVVVIIFGGLKRGGGVAFTVPSSLAGACGLRVVAIVVVMRVVVVIFCVVGVLCTLRALGSICNTIGALVLLLVVIGGLVLF